MEFPNLGQHCAKSTCNQLDFLPMKCDACESIFCLEHFTYDLHSCPSSYKKNIQVPVCPLCNNPVPVARGTSPDLGVSKHIDNLCQSDPAKQKRIYSNACSVKTCKKKELVPVTCESCRLNYCLKHRLEMDHQCQGFQKTVKPVSNSGFAAMFRSKKQSPSNVAHAISAVQGNVSEDEALARAMQISLSTDDPKTQEDRDRELAEKMQRDEYSGDNAPPTQTQNNNNNNNRSTCRVA